MKVSENTSEVLNLKILNINKLLLVPKKIRKTLKNCKNLLKFFQILMQNTPEKFIKTPEIPTTS
jgi:hypothetical protein